ncbi:MAG: hypothetical protein ACREVO_13090, partial [Steroidobacteraceae bacterium]
MHLSRIANRRVGGALLAAVAVSLTACGSSGESASQAAASAPPPVTVVAVEPQQVPLTSDFTGRVSAYREANVLARVSGVLLKRFY